MPAGLESKGLIYLLTIIEVLFIPFHIINYLYFDYKVKNNVSILIVGCSFLLIIYPLLYCISCCKFYINEKLYGIITFRYYFLTFLLYFMLVFDFIIIFIEECYNMNYKIRNGVNFCLKWADPPNIEENIILLFIGTFGLIFSIEMYKDILNKYQKYLNEKYCNEILESIKINN